MQLRAVIIDDSYMKEFNLIITTIAKMTKELICTILPDRMVFMVQDNPVQSVPLCWTDIEAKSYFCEYTMFGYSNERNKIVLSINPLKLAIALSALKSDANYFKLKLVNTDFTCLSVDIQVPSLNTADIRNISHEVPVTIISWKEWDEFELPKLPVFSSTLTMPSLRQIRSLVDKLKNLAATMTVYCVNKGDLSFVTETDLATVASHYQNLEVFMDNPGTAADDEISCRVNAKTLATCFNSNQFQMVQMYCNISQNKLLKLCIEIRENVTMNYVLMAIENDD